MDCGTCLNNDDGFCDYLGILVEDTDKPHCKDGKGWNDGLQGRRVLREQS